MSVDPSAPVTRSGTTDDYILIRGVMDERECFRATALKCRILKTRLCIDCAVLCVSMGMWCYVHRFLQNPNANMQQHTAIELTNNVWRLTVTSPRRFEIALLHPHRLVFEVKDRHTTGEWIAAFEEVQVFFDSLTSSVTPLTRVFVVAIGGPTGCRPASCFCPRESLLCHRTSRQECCFFLSIRHCQHCSCQEGGFPQFRDPYLM